MDKHLLSNLPKIFFQPKKYFEENIKNIDFMLSDLIIVGAIIFISFAILQLLKFQNDIFNQTVHEFSIYYLAFSLGITFSFITKSYILALILNKMNIEISGKTVGMIIGVSSITTATIFVFKLLFSSRDSAYLLDIIDSFWNFSLILIGILTLAQIKLIKGIIAVLILFGFDIMLRTLLQGMFQNI